MSNKYVWVVRYEGDESVAGVFTTKAKAILFIKKDCGYERCVSAKWMKYIQKGEYIHDAMNDNDYFSIKKFELNEGVK